MLFNPNGTPLKPMDDPQEYSIRAQLAMWYRMNAASPQDPKPLVCPNKKCPSRKPQEHAFTIAETGMIVSRSALDPTALNISITCPACATELAQVTGCKPTAPPRPSKVVPLPPRQGPQTQ